MNCYPWMEMRETRWHRPDMRYEGTLSAMAREERWAGGANKRRTLSYFMKARLVAPAGFEPAVSALRGLRPGPLDDGATFRWECRLTMLNKPGMRALPASLGQRSTIRPQRLLMA